MRLFCLCTFEDLRQLSDRVSLEFCLYSYFEKGCRKKYTRQSRKVLWVVFSSPFSKEISNSGKRGHGRMFASTKGKQ